MLQIWTRSILSVAVIFLAFKASSAQPPPDPLTLEERAWLATHPVIRLAPDPHYQPIEFFDEQGVYRGITADYLALIEERLGLRFQITQKELAQRVGMKPDEVGFDVTPLTAETPARREYWLFTRPYLEFPAHLITRKGVSDSLTLGDLSSARIAVVKNYAVQDYLTTQYPKLLLDLVPDTRIGLQKVSFGLVDAFVSDLPVATHWMEQEGISNLKIAGASGYVYRMGISTRKDWPELHRILEKGLATITPEERATIYRKWVKLPVSPLLTRQQWLLVILGGFSLVGLGLAGSRWWNRSLAAQVKKSTAELKQEVQEHEVAKQALRESEDHLRTIIETTPECVKLLDNRGTLLSMNTAGLKIIGAHDANEVLGQCIYQLVAPEQQESFRVFNERICAGERGSFGCEIISLEGVHRQIETFAVPIYDQKLGMSVNLSITRDVTERKRAEEALQQSESLFRSLTETTSAWVFIAQGAKLLYFNAAAEAGTGYTRTELVDKEIWAVIHPDDHQLIRERIEARVRGLPLSLNYEVRALTKVGETRWMQVTTTRIEYQGAAAELSTAFDITDRKRGEEQLRISEQRLHQLAGYLQTAREQERTRIAREIHDELGQAMTALKMDLAWLAKQLPGEQTSLHERLQGMNDLANDTIKTVRRLVTQLRPGVLDDLGLLAALEWQAHEFQTRTGITCEFIADAEVNDLSPEHATALFRICQESLTNVARHAQATEVTIHLWGEGNHLLLEVKDNGRGITINETTNSCSFGLQGMQERAFLLGGEFHLTGSPNKGTTVTARIPRSQSMARGGGL